MMDTDLHRFLDLPEDGGEDRDVCDGGRGTLVTAARQTASG
jgi:hypothetical protein